MGYEHERQFSLTELHQNPTLTLALHTLSIGKQALVFVSSKASAEKVAETIAKKAPKGDDEQQKLAEKVRGALSKPTKQCERLGRCMRNGIAFHHSGLVGEQREAIEEGFRNGTVKIICCTPTLAAGVDLPAFRTILKDLKRYAGNWGMQWIPMLEYQQMCGRAGRPGMEDYGEAIAIASSEGERDEIFSRYLLGTPEDIYSKLAVEPVLRTYLLSLIVSGIVRDINQIYSFFEKTFWAHQYGDMYKLKQIIRKVLDLLEDYEFIQYNATKDDFSSGDQLLEEENNIVRATRLGTRVSQLYIDPLTAHYMINCLKRTHTVSYSQFSLLQMVCNTLEMRPLLTVRVKEYEMVQEKLNASASDLLSREPTIYDTEFESYLQSIKTAMLLEAWTNELDEEYILNTYNARPGELRAKLDNGEWLLHGAEEMAKLLAFREVGQDIAKLRFRLKYGVKEELFALLKLKNIGRVRARKLYNNGVKDIAAVKSVDLTTLSQLLGKALARDIKQQVGVEVPEQDMEEVKPAKKKKTGQISLTDYHGD